MNDSKNITATIVHADEFKLATLLAQISTGGTGFGLTEADFMGQLLPTAFLTVQPDQPDHPRRRREKRDPGW